MTSSWFALSVIGEDPFLTYLYIISNISLWISHYYAFQMSSLYMYRKTSSISRTLVGNKIVDNSDVVGASPVGAAPTTSSFST